MDRLKEIGLPESIAEVHNAITRKHPIDGSEFDAWYTDRPCVLERLAQLGQSIASQLRKDIPIHWGKGLPEDIRRLLEAKDAVPKGWEDAPDGALAGIAIILAGWVAMDQSTAEKCTSS